MSLPSWKSYLRSILFSPFRCFTSSCYFLFSTFFLSSKEYHESIISSFFFGTLLPSFFFFFFLFCFFPPYISTRDSYIFISQETPISSSPKRLSIFQEIHAFLLPKKPCFFTFQETPCLFTSQETPCLFTSKIFLFYNCLLFSSFFFVFFKDK